MTTPEGLLVALFRPEIRLPQDWNIYLNTDLDEVLHKSLLIICTQYFIFGDYAYQLREWLQTYFIMAHDDFKEREVNGQMAAVVLL